MTDFINLAIGFLVGFLAINYPIFQKIVWILVIVIVLMFVFFQFDGAPIQNTNSNKAQVNYYLIAGVTIGGLVAKLRKSRI